jgi:hypothetical protein
MNAMAVKTDTPQVPHPIYGNVPIGRDSCTLEAQPIQMLNVWHEKAVSAAKNYSDAHPKMGDDDSGYDVLYSSKWEIFEAAFKTSIHNCDALAALIQIVNRHACDCGDVEVALDLEKLQIIARISAAVTAPLSPKKRTGKLRRGNKLTAFGLIYRYQAFLIQELETIGWHVYGERDYPMMSRHYDDAVNARCRLSSGRGAYPIFFNPKSLPARARSVLKSLKIDTENAGERAR